jgi:hypothetical protein
MSGTWRQGLAFGRLQLVGSCTRLIVWQRVLLVYLVIQAYLVPIEGKEAFLGTTPAVGMELGLSQPSKDLLGLQFSCHGAIICLADKVPDDACVSMAEVLVYNEPCIVGLEAFLHHAEHPKHLLLV